MADHQDTKAQRTAERLGILLLFSWCLCVLVVFLSGCAYEKIAEIDKNATKHMKVFAEQAVRNGADNLWDSLQGWTAYYDEKFKQAKTPDDWASVKKERDEKLATFRPAIDSLIALYAMYAVLFGESTARTVLMAVMESPMSQFGEIAGDSFTWIGAKMEAGKKKAPAVPTAK